MENLKLKEQVLKKVMEGDEALLQIMLDVANDYSGQDFDETSEKALLEKRRLARMNGEIRLHSWKDAKQIISQSLYL
jgi:hypothetical protein